MRRSLRGTVLILALISLSFGLTSLGASKLPKCSGQFCRGLGCDPTALCVSGSKVLSCADICKM